MKPGLIEPTASSAFVRGIRKCQAWVDFQGQSPIQNKEGFVRAGVGSGATSAVK